MTDRATFDKLHAEYLKNLHSEDPFGFNLDQVVKLEPLLSFLFHDWWKIDLTGLRLLPQSGPALVVGNAGGVLPWPGLMLMLALMSSRERPRRLRILVNLDWIEDERIYRFLEELGFVSWSSSHAKQLFRAGEIVMVFPEGIEGWCKPFSERYRLREFNWTMLLPAVEENAPIFPLATLGFDEAIPVLANPLGLAELLDLPAFPVTPFFPWLPAPASLGSRPIPCKMRLLKNTHYFDPENPAGSEPKNSARRQSLFIQGEIQAELNRLLRMRSKPFSFFAG